MKTKLFVMSVWFLVLSASSGYAEKMIYIYHPPESKEDTRYNYHWDVLKVALEKTRTKYGRYIMKPGWQMNENRQVHELTKGQDLTIMIRGASKEYEKMFTPVRIPLDKGLIGYRVFLIHKGNQSKFSTIRTLDELRKLTVGQGMGWSDVTVWKHGRFEMVEGPSYEGLFSWLPS